MDCSLHWTLPFNHLILKMLFLRSEETSKKFIKGTLELCLGRARPDFESKHFWLQSICLLEGLECVCQGNTIRIAPVVVHAGALSNNSLVNMCRVSAHWVFKVSLLSCSLMNSIIWLSRELCCQIWTQLGGLSWLISGVCPGSEVEHWYPQVQRSAILLLKTASRKEPRMEVKGYILILDPSNLQLNILERQVTSGILTSSTGHVVATPTTLISCGNGNELLTYLEWSTRDVLLSRSNI